MLFLAYSSPPGAMMRMMTIVFIGQIQNQDTSLRAMNIIAQLTLMKLTMSMDLIMCLLMKITST
jgi:hypothetical protein